MYIEVPENLVRRIHELAQGEDEILAELLGIVIESYDANPPKWATLGDLQRHAREAIKRYSKDPPFLEVDGVVQCRDTLSADSTNYQLRREPH